VTSQVTADRMPQIGSVIRTPVLEYRFNGGDRDEFQRVCIWYIGADSRNRNLLWCPL